ncbi:tetratricopeptide repeat protein [Leucothrix sargassi]|nr:tetratricopeptide repeat protein [Leucothrix sargassi]
MPLFIIGIVIQIGFVIHVIKTGRNTMWVWAIMGIPFLGAAAYFFVEILPLLLGTRTGWQARKKITEVINPNKDLNKANHDFEVADTVQNSSRLAAEHLEKDQFEEAKALYEKCLSGIHEDDPYFLYGRAQAEFGLKQYSEVKQTLDDLIRLNPTFKNIDAHLLYAKNLVELGETDAAMSEFEVLNETYLGPEASYRYAMLLKSQGKEAEADKVFDEILKKAKLADRHYRDRYKHWINLTKAELNN